MTAFEKNLLICFNEKLQIGPPDGSLRLADGTNYGDAVYEGRVEVYHNNQWGTICNDIYGTAVNGGPQNVNTVATAQVICNQLGYGVVATSFQFPDAECENFPNAYHVGVRNSLRQHKLR